MPTVVLLGPQNRQPTLAAELDRFAISGPVAAVTAGWKEREAEDEALIEHIGRPVTDLLLHRRADEVFLADAELFAAYRARQDRLRAMQQLYRYRLDFTIEPARELLRREGDDEVVVPEREAAMEAVRRLDADHLRRVDDHHRRFIRTWKPAERPAVADQRRRLAEILGDCAALLVAGGHVAVLLNRLRLFGVIELIGDMPIFAWSAGAMVLAERVVLFHDRPPQGAGNTEVLETGLGIAPGIVPLPHADRRLQLDDPHRVALFARRFAPDRPIVLDQGSALSRRDGAEAWDEIAGGRWLTQDGDVLALGDGA